MKKWLFVTSLLFLRSAHCDEPIRLHFHERPPFYISAKGKLAGIVGQIAHDTFDRANIEYVLLPTPAMRQLIIIKGNNDHSCGVGWFKNQERIEIAKFTRAIYKDTPTIVVTRKNHPYLKEKPTIDDLFKNKSLLLLIKNGYSYGKTLDEKIKLKQPKTREVSQNTFSMFQMLTSMRADYMFITREEYDSVVKNSQFIDSQFFHYAPTDSPPGECRYIICSRQVPDSVIEKLNQEIPKIGGCD